MMKTNRQRNRAVALLMAAVLIGMMLTQVSASVFEPFSSYTYSNSDGSWYPLLSPPPFASVSRMTGAEMGAYVDFVDPSDIFMGPDGKLYVVDTGNNRICVFDEDMEMVAEIESFPNEANIERTLMELIKDEESTEAFHATIDELPIDESIKEEYKNGIEGLWLYYEEQLAGMGPGVDPALDSLNKPEGVFVTEDGTIFVADTGAERLLKLWFEYETNSVRFISETTELVSDVLSAEFVFKPQQVVVDQANRVYVMVKDCNLGIAELVQNEETQLCDFVGWYGAQKTRTSLVAWFLELFMSEEQRANSAKIVPRVYNNMVIDSSDFIWLTADSMETFEKIDYLTSGETVVAPIRRLNTGDDDILKREAANGMAPGGDYDNYNFEPSSIVDVTVRENGCYTLVDSKRNKLFTYDESGNLLYAFGGTGSQLGVFTLIKGAVYDTKNDLLVLDKGSATITRFSMTEYARMIDKALDADKKRMFEESRVNWLAVHKQNANFDLAYVGIAKALYRNQRYEDAMKYYKEARNTEGYSQVFKEYRSRYVSDNIFLVLGVLAAVFVLIYLFNRWVKKVNAIEHVTGTPTSFTQEVLYGFRAMYHPLNGFWEIKREKRGSMRGAIFILCMAMLAFCYKATGTAYLFNPGGINSVNIMQEALNVLIPVLLWCLASWALTTLFSGEGSMKDIFIAVCYALLPMVIIIIPATIASNFMSLDESAFLTFFYYLSYIWTGYLIVFGSMVIQDYHFSKNMLTVIASIVGIGAIMFLVLLLFSLTAKITSFFGDIYKELSMR